MAARNGNGHGKNGNGGVYPNHRRRRRQRRRRDRIVARRFAIFTIIAVILGGIAAVVAAAFTSANGVLNNCDLASLKPVSIGQNSFVYAADGSLLGAIPAERNRQPVELDGMSPLVRAATVDIEDRRFYEHGGLDYEGILRAAVKNLESGHVVQGGSTITQQLVRNLYIGNERSLQRKIKEACLARKLESAHDKNWILATYLNQVYFGNHAYGVEAAAQTYFSKHAKDLTLVQAAMIAGMPQAPSVYDPFQRPDEAVRRRNDVLTAMLSAGDIDRAQYDEAVASPLKLKRGSIYTKVREPYFFSYVREELIAKYGANTVRGGGLKVYTTIVPRFQKLAEQAIKKTLYYPNDPASAIVSINPKNGAIRAMTAVIPGKKHTQFNLAAQGRRQAGSSFKTFVLTEAIRRGINPDSTPYLSAPLHWQPDPYSEAWDVSTYAGDYYGPSSITQSTLRSDNTVYARMTLDLGPENIVRLAHKMGITTKLEPVASVGLGSNSVGVLEMADAYATIAAGGIHSDPMAIRKVVLPNGKVDEGAGWGHPKRKRVFSDGVAYAVSADPEDEHPGRHGRWGEPWVSGRRQDRDDRGLGRRLVRGDHDECLDGRLGRLSEREDPHDRGARDSRRRRNLPGDDLAALHGAGVQPQPSARLALAHQPGGLDPVARPVPELRRASPAAEGQEEGQEGRQGRLAADDHRAAADDD